MKWDFTTIQNYLDVKEYIDTAIIPIISIDLEETAKNSLARSTIVTGVGNYIEEQLKGRVMLFPSFSYIPHQVSDLVATINEQTKYIAAHGFKHIVWLTGDAEWNTYSEKLQGQWLIFAQEELQEMTEVNPAQIRQFGEQLLPRFSEYWEKG